MLIRRELPSKVMTEFCPCTFVVDKGNSGQRPASLQESVLQMLLDAYPQAAQVPDFSGILPLHCAARSEAVFSPISLRKYSTFIPRLHPIKMTVVEFRFIMHADTCSETPSLTFEFLCKHCKSCCSKIPRLCNRRIMGRNSL